MSNEPILDNAPDPELDEFNLSPQDRTNLSHLILTSGLPAAKKALESHFGIKSFEALAHEIDPEVAAKRQVLKAFLLTRPQFVNDPASNAKLLEWLQARSRAIDQESLADAFQALAREGEIRIDPCLTGLVDAPDSEEKAKQLGLDNNGDLTGPALANHPNLNGLLAPVTGETYERNRVMRMDPNSAEFKKWDSNWRKEVTKNQPLPPIVRQTVERVFLTFRSFHPEFLLTDNNREKLFKYIGEHEMATTLNNVEIAYRALKDAGELELSEGIVAESSNARWTEYPKDEVNHTEKQASLARKVASMSAQEYDHFISSPANRRAVDSL